MTPTKRFEVDMRVCVVTPRTSFVQALCAAAARMKGCLRRGKAKNKSGCSVEAVTLPTHPPGKRADFENKSSAVCCLMYSGLWCECVLSCVDGSGGEANFQCCFKKVLTRKNVRQFER